MGLLPHGADAPELTVALFVPDPLRAVSASEALRGEAGDALRSKLARSPYRFQVAQINGVSRSEGGCISVVLTGTASPAEAAADGALGSSAALVEASLRTEIGRPPAPDAALERVARTADLVAAELAAWWTFATDHGGDPVVAVSASLPESRASATKSAAAVLDAAPNEPPVAVDHVERDESGQGELWVLLGNPCAAIEEGGHQWGGASLAARARALDVSGERDVAVEAFAAPEGVGVFAHAPIGAGEADDDLARRVAAVASKALLGSSASRDALARAQASSIGDLEGAWGPRAFGLDAFARAFAPEHPSVVEPRGTVTDLMRSDYARATGSWAALASGPLRLVTLTNRSPTQGPAAAVAVDAWLLPSQVARGCAKLDATEPDRSPKQIDVALEDRGVALFGLRAEPPMATILVELARAERPQARARFEGGIVVLEVESGADHVDADVDAVTAMLTRLARGEVSDEALARARDAARATALREAADPRARLLALFAKRSTPATFAPVEPASVADFKAWARAQAAPDRWVVIRER
ncbi:MAG: hypothetical protein U0414_25460 [Polyangiaceae bacterium]